MYFYLVKITFNEVIKEVIKMEQEKTLLLKIGAFKALSGWSRTLMAAASIILALSATFVNVTSAGHKTFLLLLAISWLSLLMSILYGGLLTGSIVAHLNNRSQEELDAQDAKLMTRSAMQWLAFCLGIMFFTVYSLLDLFF